MRPLFTVSDLIGLPDVSQSRFDKRISAELETVAS